MADSVSCLYSCCADGFMSVDIWRRMADAIVFDDDRTGFTFRYRRIQNPSFYPIPIFVRQST